MPRAKEFAFVAFVALSTSAGALAQTHAPAVSGIRGTWRAGTVVLRIADDGAHPAVDYADDGHPVAVRDARFDLQARTLRFLLAGHGSPGAQDRVAATTVELVLSADGTSLAGRIVAMTVGTLTFHRAPP